MARKVPTETPKAPAIAESRLSFLSPSLKRNYRPIWTRAIVTYDGSANLRRFVRRRRPSPPERNPRSVKTVDRNPSSCAGRHSAADGVSAIISIPAKIPSKWCKVIVGQTVRVEYRFATKSPKLMGQFGD
jgi:hypothetical protein